MFMWLDEFQLYISVGLGELAKFSLDVPVTLHKLMPRLPYKGLDIPTLFPSTYNETRRTPSSIY
jgi:hypothetical protein